MNTKYKEPILKLLLNSPLKKFTKVSLKQKLDIKKNEIYIFNKNLNDLIKENIILKSKKNKYFLNTNLDLYLGKFIQNPKGYGFVDELFIPPRNINTALDGDIVAVRIRQENDTIEGEIISILKRNTNTIVGTYIQKKGDKFGFVIADSERIISDIYIPNGNSLNAKSYDKVIINIQRYAEGTKKMVGKVIEVLGFKNEIGVDYLSVINEYKINNKFSAKTKNQIEKIPDKIKESELKNRKDLTDMCIFTIDGIDSKDLDDAISIEKITKNQYRLGVHIADVSHYVKEDSPLDKEAFNRGTSVYLIDKVIPMLPKKLSNNLCSLNPLETRLSLSVFMNINSNGTVTKYEICESYISSKSKLYYENVNKYFDNLEELKVDEKIKDTEMEEKIKQSLSYAKELSLILKKKRQKRGALDFQLDECKIKLNEYDKPISVEVNERGISNKIIEEFMIVTNEVVAEHFNNLKIPFVYRIHESPKEEKLSTFLNFIKNLGYEMPIDFSPKTLQSILDDIKGKPEEATVSLILLQAMQQAKYYQDELGHFGLATTYYSHFTSPIRRYPDLQIHRIIKDYLNKNLSSVKLERYKKKVVNTSIVSSKRERLAQKAEEDYERIKKCEFMEDKIGQKFTGVITSISKTNIKVLLPNTVEGIIYIKANDQEGNYKILQENCSVENPLGKRYVVGDNIEVKLKNVSVDKKIILFELV